MRATAVMMILGSFHASAQTGMLAARAHMEVVSGNLDAARREVKQADTRAPDYPEALSWVARGELAARNFTAAEADAGQVRKLCLARLTNRSLDADSTLAAALGAAIEVTSMAAAVQGRRDEAVSFLKAELVRWHGSSIRARIQKNLNLLTLEGKPAPPLETAVFLSGPAPKPLTALRGHPVLLFFWAHWCSDCKNEIPVIQKLRGTYGSRGLIVVAPTQHYGYVGGGEEAPQAVETRYIQAVFTHYYAGIGPVAIPVSEENFARYGVSTTPTLVLIDARGIVRLYNPGNAPYEELAAKLDALLRPGVKPASR